MSECNHDCSSCGENCQERKIEKITTNEESKVHRLIGVLSGKGGVGKSFVASLLATELQKRHHQAAILDADITGPSIPQAFGITQAAMGENQRIFPAVSAQGIRIISSSMFLEHKEDPIIWRGVMLGEMVKQFYHDVLWEEVDYMIVDMPPGTGDVALTAFQYLPLDGLVIVTSPQELVSTIVQKAVIMAEMMNIPILGIVENMAYVECPKCGDRIDIYGPSHLQEMADRYHLPILARLPLDPSMALKADQGLIEEMDGSLIKSLVDVVEKMPRKETEE